MPAVVSILLLMVAASFASAGDIHRWQDGNGNIHFGDRPPAAAETKIISVKPNIYASPSIERNDSLLADEPNVVMYSAQWCGYCKKARSFFTANDIPFKEYDVEKSKKGQRDYKKLKAQGVPVILVGKQRLNGFSEDAFRQVYGPAGS